MVEGTEIYQCYATGNVSGNTWVGGLAGTLAEELPGFILAGKISDCYSRGRVLGMSRVGGLVGLNIGIIDNSYSTGLVSYDGGWGL